MQEALWVTGLVLLVFAYGAVELVPWPDLLEAGSAVMLGSASIGLPLEAIYYLLLGLALKFSGQMPQGWYWRPFEHHHLLGRRQRWLILPFFYTGALSFLVITLGIITSVLGMVAAFRQHG